MNNNQPVKIVETVLRDGHQSLAATRMRITDMIPMLEQLDEAGFHALEGWGGATFDSCLRFLGEDPWERLRTLKQYLKKTPIQMLLRGQNVLGYNHYADDVVREFVNRAVDNGVGIIRIFDALNDVRNLEVAMKASKAAGAHVQGAFVYTISPYHNQESFLKVAKELVELGADSICIKDMSGLLAPYAAYDLVKALKADITIPIQLHTHYTSGMASMTYLKAIEAGVDIVDCALSPFALGTSQPATEAIVATLEGTPRDTGIKKETLYPIADHFRAVKKELAGEFNLNTAIDIDTKVLSFQIPGGMLSNLLNQMKEQGMADKYPELLEEMPRVRAELGYPPLVTPTSQITGSMAAFNVMLGRYKIIPREIKDLVRGKYGRTPAPIDPEFRKMIVGDEPVITHRPADDIAPQMDALRQELAEKGYPNASTEDVLSYALFPEVALGFFSKHR
ncbi:pyruvate carboxylase subunit B [Sporomusa sp.]|jgi:oxaloacetate decarboxylase alpha subunit|uniref:pyruvate carboxylase subunit B n=1 Tax=Sporomusa sp. TaxID=2078658 RepID=UPI002C360F62|nr:pyruvate carboxylase subunit B [Sporomusa sp.]MDF2873823.1 Methylmalonyl-CoA carboxyltransferase subunit [Sporomusa sp.]HWR05437.1 pyruvate carboxylase subunit B [Sporomusa sp.]